MFIGHFGVALAAKKVAPRTSLGVLVLAAQFADLLWPILLLAGVEHVEIVPGIIRVSPSISPIIRFPTVCSCSLCGPWSSAEFTTLSAAIGAAPW